MGAGKTSVGRAVAAALGWRFLDFDHEIELQVGLSVSEIFAEHGEPYFREIEQRVGDRLLREEEVVLGSGGGWAAQAGRLESVPAGTVTIWLDVSAEEAVRRLAQESERRPLLAGADAVATARELLAERTRSYRAAAWRVDTERSSVEDVSARILEMLAERHP